MGNRTAKFISALVGSIIAGAPLAAVSQNAPTQRARQMPRATASPRQRAPRRRASIGTIASSARPSGNAGICAPKAARTAPRPADRTGCARYADGRFSRAAAAPGAGRTRRISDAAEHPRRRRRMRPHQRNRRRCNKLPAPSADSNAQQPAVATRWPDASAAAPSPAPQAAPAPVAPPAAAEREAVEIPCPGRACRSRCHHRQSDRLAPDAAARDRRRAGARRPPRQHHLSLRRRTHASRPPTIVASTGTIGRHARRRPRALARRDASCRAACAAAAPGGFRCRPSPGGRASPSPPTEATQREAAQLAAIDHAIDAVDQRAPQARHEVAELDEADMFNGEFEIEASAPRLAANDINDKGGGRSR